MFWRKAWHKCDIQMTSHLYPSPLPHYQLIAKRNHNAAFIIWYINYCKSLLYNQYTIGVHGRDDCPDKTLGLAQIRPRSPDNHFLCFCILPERDIMRIKTHFKCHSSLNTIHYKNRSEKKSKNICRMKFVAASVI